MRMRGRSGIGAAVLALATTVAGAPRADGAEKKGPPPAGVGRLIEQLGHDRTIRLWDVDTGKGLKRFEGHTEFVHCAVVSPDGRGGGRAPP